MAERLNALDLKSRERGNPGLRGFESHRFLMTEENIVYCSLCDKQIEEKVFDCYKCAKTLCAECVGKPQTTCMGMCDLLCPTCGEVVLMRLRIKVPELPEGAEELLRERMENPVERKPDTRFRPPSRRRRRRGVKPPKK